MKEKYIIGIGDSWTHGEGGWNDYILKKYSYQVQHYKHRIQPPLEPEELAEIESIEREHSWVNQLCTKYLTDYKPLNLGMPGRGNHSAVRNLRFLDPSIDLTDSIIILMLTHCTRYDMFRDDPNERWFTGHPADPNNFDKENFEHCFGASYATFSFGVGESVYVKTLLDMLELQDFAQNNGAKFLVCNGFEEVDLPTITSHSEIHQKFIWENWIHNQTEYGSFMELLLSKEEYDGDDWRRHFQSLEKPSTFITNCQGAHPTIQGHDTIAKHLAKLINSCNEARVSK